MKGEISFEHINIKRITLIIYHIKYLDKNRKFFLILFINFEDRTSNQQYQYT